jgi:hypothetical protein
MNAATATTAATVTGAGSSTADISSDTVLAVSDDAVTAVSTTYNPHLTKAASAKLLHQDALQSTDVTADVGAYDSVEVDVEVKWTGPSRWHSSHNKVYTPILMLIYNAVTLQVLLLYHTLADA